MGQSNTSLAARVRHIALTFVGMSGLRLDRSRAQIALTAVGIGASYVATELFVGTRSASIAYAVAIWLTYYVGHIAFYRTPLHRLMRRRLGDDRAYVFYEAILGIVYFNQGWCQVRLLLFFEGTWEVALPTYVLFAASLALFAIGSVTKVWATTLVGLDVYYYRDMFAEQRGEGGLVTSGPYAFLANPMYSVGMLTAYGGALEAGSFEGLACAAIFHASIYVFYYSIERPFVRRMYGTTPNTPNTPNIQRKLGQTDGSSPEPSA